MDSAIDTILAVTTGMGLATIIVGLIILFL